MTPSSDPQEASTDDLIGINEGEQHVIYITRALESDDVEVQLDALIEGMMLFGFRFGNSLSFMDRRAGNQGRLEDLNAKMKTIVSAWLTGQNLTDRIDENERRAQMATFMLQAENVSLERLAARCLLSLPEGHPQRDIALAHAALLRRLEQCRASDEVESQIQVISDLLKYNLEPKENTLELIREGRALVERVSNAGFCGEFRIRAIQYYATLASHAGDEGRPAERSEWAGKMQEIFEDIRAKEPEFLETPDGMTVAAVVMHFVEQPAEAKALFTSAVDSSAPGDDSYEGVATIEARYRMGSDEYERVVEILTPLVPGLEERYLTAIEDTAVAKAGEEFSETIGALALAHAHLNHWDEAFTYLERGKSLRLRYRAALRRSPSGKRLLELEIKLYALSRGVPVEGSEFYAQKTEDWLGANVSLKNKVLEAYRIERPRLSPELLAVPSIADIARSLEADEAVVTLGLDERGTLAAVVCHSDEKEPSGRFLLPDWPLHRWAKVFVGEQQDGWLYALGAPELKLDQKPLLPYLLNQVDEALGQTLQSFLRKRKVRRVTIIPHRWFHFVPFWALPSFENFDVVIAASAAHFVQARHTVEPTGGRALVVSDPTLDLAASLAEADAVERTLSRLNFDVTRLEGGQATEDAVVGALPGVSIFHFCGHGHSDVGNPERSALLVSPNLSNLPADVSDPFAYYLTDAEDWQQEDDDLRSRAIPGFGRLYEKSTAEGQLLERRIEYGERGSLLGRYRDGKLAMLAEMWTAGDILVDSPLGDCRLAFLSACEAGSGSIGVGVEEYSGLPAALQLAGVATVVCSLWPVLDALTALYVDLFYETLAEAPQPVDVGKVVHKVGRRLRRMKRERAVALLNRLRRQTTSPVARWEFEVFAARTAAGEKYPFKHPYDWAAFYATGTSTIQFKQGDAS